MAAANESPRAFRHITGLEIAVLLGMLVLLASGFGLRWLLQAPDPRINGITPNRVEALRRARLTLAGSDFRPFLTARVELGEKRFLSRLLMDQRADDAMIVPFRLETSERAMLDVPRLPPGTYDVALYEETREVSRLSGAITVDPLDAMRTVSGFQELAAPDAQVDPIPATAGKTGTVRVKALFTAPPETLALVHRDVQTSDTRLAPMLTSIDDVQPVAPVQLRAPHHELFWVKATLRWPAARTPDGRWQSSDQRLAAGTTFTFKMPDYVLTGVMLDVREERDTASPANGAAQ